MNIKFGLDANKIKGVNNFPIYDATGGFTSHAKSNVDSYMFHSSHKYDVPKATHTSVGEIQPYYYNKTNPSHPIDSNVRMRAGELSLLYGLPPDKTIVLENPTAQAMNLMGGKMTEEKLRDHYWKLQENIDNFEYGNFLSHPNVIAFMDVDEVVESINEPVVVNRLKGIDGVKGQQKQERKERSIAKAKKREENPVVVERAFEINQIHNITDDVDIVDNPALLKSKKKEKPMKTNVKGETSLESKKKEKPMKTNVIEETSLESNKREKPMKTNVIGEESTEKVIEEGNRYDFMYEIEKNINIMKMDPKGKNTEEQKKITTFLIENDYATPHSNISINESFISSVIKILSLPREKLTPKKKTAMRKFINMSRLKSPVKQKATTPMSIEESLFFEKDG